MNPLLFVCSSLFLAGTQGLTPIRRVEFFSRAQLTPLTPLRVAAPVHLDEDSAASLLNQAVDCSMSESCSIEDAEYYLREILEIESACTVGILVDRDVCENQSVLATVVSQLKEKIARGIVKKEHKSLMVEDVVALGFLSALVAVVLTTNFGGKDTTAFTLEEWWWSIRDHYFHLMLVSFLKNGGLSI